MTVIEAAESLGVTPSTIRNQIAKRKLRAKKVGRDWHITPAEVERYRREHRGQRKRPNLHAPETVALRYEALKRPDVRAKMRAAKLGKPAVLTPEGRERLREKSRNQQWTPEQRAQISARQKGVPKSAAHRWAIQIAALRPEVRAAHSAWNLGHPKSAEVRAKIAAAKRGVPHSEETKARRRAAMDRIYLSHGRFHSALEQRAAEWLLPLGYRRFPRFEGHAFDFGTVDLQTVIEVNGCYWHDHRAVDPTCPTTPRPGRLELDQRYRAIAYRNGLTLVELWGCQEASWPALLPTVDAA